MRHSVARTLLVAWVAAAGLAGAPVLAAGGMIRQQTAHYLIESDVSAAFTKEVAQHMEAIFAEYLRRLQDFGGEIKERFQVKVFQRKEDYLNLVGSQMANTAGIYISQKRLLAAYVGPMRHDQVLRTLYHEGFHQFTDAYLGSIGRMPPWISEGLAQLFEEATWNNKRFEIGGVPTEKLFALEASRKNGFWISLDDLVGLSQKEWQSNLVRSLESGQAEYAEAWAVVHFLVYAEKGKYRKALIAYLKLMDGAEAPRTAFQKAFGSNLKGFEQRWEAYLKTLKPSPKFECRRNLMLLALLIPQVSEREKACEDVAAFHRYVRDAFDAGMQISTYGQQPISRAEPERIEALFRCPEDKRPDVSDSYAVSGDPAAQDAAQRTAGVALRCVHHPGIEITGRCVLDKETGRWMPIVEEGIAKKPQAKASGVAK